VMVYQSGKKGNRRSWSDYEHSELDRA